MFKDDEDDEENTFGVTRYACMPSLVALQQMRNRLHLAHLGRKLMKWTALATGRELRKIALELDEDTKDLSQEMRNAFIMLARARYFCPDLNKIVTENVGHHACVTVAQKTHTVTAVKIAQFEIIESGAQPYEHLGLEKGGQAIQETKKEWLELLKKLVLMMQLRKSFMMVDMANKSATKKSNVLGKIIVPRLNETTHYINSELEEREREEVFRLKRVKQKKEWEKEIEKQKRQGLIDEKGMPIKSEDRKDTAPPSKAESTTNSLGGSRTNLNRPPETVNLLILNPRDELDPTSVSSTFISPYGGKTIPGITRVDELIDEKDSVNNLTVAEIKVDRSKESEDKRIDEQHLNEPARKLVHEITKGGNVDGSQNKNIHDTSRTKDNIATSILSETMTDRTLQQDSENLQGYSADLEVSEKDVRNIQQSNALDSFPTVNSKDIKAKYDAIKETPKKTNIDQIDSEDMSKIKPDTAEPTVYEVKNIPGTTNLMPVKTTSSNIDTESSNSKNENIDGEKLKFTNDDKTDQQHLNTPAKILISEVVKDIITDKDKTKKIMKDAETIHDISMSSVATQYEYMDEQVAERRKTPASDQQPKVHIDSSHNVEKDLKINDDTEENWEFVLANDQQGDDVDTKPIIIKEIRDIKENDANSIDNATSSKFLKIKDSITCIRNSSDMDETEDDVSEDGKTSKDKEKKKRKKRKKKENVDDKCSEDPTNH